MGKGDIVFLGLNKVVDIIGSCGAQRHSRTGGRDGSVCGNVAETLEDLRRRI